jgi:predicted negative regulator of RcsB-dependent stress response
MLSQEKIINIVIAIIFGVLGLLSYSLYGDLDTKKQQVTSLQMELQNKTVQLEDQAKKIADLEAKISEHTRKTEKHAAPKKAQHGKATPHPKKAQHKKGR